MSAVVLTDRLGPRARRRVVVATVVSAVLLALVIALGLRRFAAEGQLDADLYTVFLDPDVSRLLVTGLLVTLRLAAVAMVLAVALGTVLALGRIARSPVLRFVSGVYVQFFRAMPVLLLIIFSRFGLPALGLRFSDFTYLTFALVAYNSAVLAEIFRAGILSLDRGQTEASYAIGLRYWQAMRIVILPQAARRMIPAIVSQLVTLLKDTSLGYIIAFRDLLRIGQTIGATLDAELQALLLVGLIYVLINLVLSRIAARLERRQRARYRADPIEVRGGPEDLVVT